MQEMTKLEMRALKALEHPAFPLNLNEIRKNIRNLLSELQRYGFFNEYTTHSYDHVHAMLEMTDWIIPEPTKSILTDGDYLFLTLSIYFHDLGLLISQHEYKNRARNQEFQRYLSEQSSTSVDHIEYMDKLNKLPTEEKDRILYQEFIRKTHGVRVRSWIEGTPLDDDNLSESIRSEIQKLIGSLDSSARQGLAILCESHTIDDLSDASKYNVSMPYGESKNETVNLQYIAIILRTVDLLQVTRSRAPSILYQVISPKDPVSQIEWQKQNAVRSIRPATGRDREGKASNSAQSDTIQFYARFEKADGFFGLTSYLAYVKAQLLSCHEALKRSETELPDPPQFPWKFIDDSGIEAVGFLKKSFGFKLDQHKILDLLTGHTLYNDTDVVIRELTQNALDAVRLQCSTDKSGPNLGRIDISWSDETRVLEVKDNGTGMSQSVIEDHLLKVGSSRYQDPKFRETYPEFTSISRFGIGVLSAFMVADSVEITTCSTEDVEARQISLRSVHGKYLIKLLDKIAHREDIGVYPHGSRIRLKLRSTANIGDILQISKMWLLFPRCEVYVKVNSAEPVRIGFESPKQALQHYINSTDFTSNRFNKDYEVREVCDAGVTLAFALERDELFNDWSFTLSKERHSYNQPEETPMIATCVEGVGVEFNTPGFKNHSILAIANIVGKGAPKTNVARSALEDTAEYRETLERIYRLYVKHITEETERLSLISDYSLSRAVEQAPYLTIPLTNGVGSASRPNILKAEIDKIPYLLIEEKGRRKNISFQDLKELEHFWTINSPLTSSIEQFVREAPKNVSASTILENLQGGDSGLPKGAILCNFGRTAHIDETVREVFEPSFIDANQSARSILMKWEKIGNTPRWVSSAQISREVISDNRKLWFEFQETQNPRGRRESNTMMFSTSDNINVSNLDEFSDFIADRQMYLHPLDPLAQYFRKVWESSDQNKNMSLFAYLTIFGFMRSYYVPREEFSSEWLERLISNNNLESLNEHIDVAPFIDAIRKRKTKTFNPFAWKRRGANPEEQ